MARLRPATLCTLAAFLLMACEFPSAGSGERDAEDDAGESAGEGVRDAGANDAGSDSELQAVPETLSFPGTTDAELEIRAEGAWSASTSTSWLSVEPDEGSGPATVTVAVDRAGLDVDAYEGSISIVGEAGDVTVPVLMRFPEVSGQVTSSDHSISLSSLDGRATEAAVPGEIIVRLDPDMVALAAHGRQGTEADASAIDRAVDRLAASVDARRSEILSYSLPLALLEVGPEATGEAIAALAADGRVHYAEPNALLRPAAVDDPHYDVQWHYDRIDIEAAWDVTKGSDDVTVAVIDGDFHPDHPDLAANLRAGWNFVDDSDEILILSEGCSAHGSHVAGTVAAVTDNAEGVAGSAPNVQMLPLNVARSPQGDDDDCNLPLDAIVRAILYAAGKEDPAAGALEHPVDVINLSLGGEFYSEAMEEALGTATEAGVVNVAAAGNTGDDVIFPASLPSVLAVSAVDQDLDVTEYSARGSEIWMAAPGGDLTQSLDGYSNPGRPPPAGVLSTGFAYDSLPGGLIYATTDDGDHAYLLKQGTSMAAPHVAGVAALMRSANRDLSPGAVAQILADTAIAQDSGERTDEYGHGILDAGAAVAVADETIVVATDDITVRLQGGGETVAQTRATSDGSFELGAALAGDYTLQAGDFEDDPLDATVFGETEVTIDYEGDVETEVSVTAR